MPKLVVDQRGQRHRHTTGGPDGAGLRAGQPQSQGAHRPAQRLRDRLDDAEIGAGGDDDLRAAGFQPSHRRAQPARRGADAVQLGDIVGADQDHRGIRRRTRHEHRVDLSGQALGGGTDNRLGAQPDTFAGLLGQSARDQHAGNFVGDPAAVPGCRRVTEDHQVQVDVHPALPALHRAAARGVHTVGARRDVPRLRDEAACLGGLADQQIARPHIGGAGRCQRARRGQRSDRTSRCASYHANSLCPGRFVSPDPGSCAITGRSNLGIESDSLIVEVL